MAKGKQRELFEGERERQRPAMVYRDMRLEVEAPVTREDGSTDPRIPIALSSEAPVERFDWWSGEAYYEVLDHSSSAAVDLSMARDGLPFLMDHSMRQQIGIIEGVTLNTKDRKLRGFVRMGNHPDAAWVEKDIRSGIRTKISVGYDPGDQYTQQKTKADEPATRVYTGWTPYEGSSVAIPADSTVGVGRAAGPVAPVPPPPPARKTEERTVPPEDQGKQPEPPAAVPASGPSAVAEAREKDLKRLTSIARDFPQQADLAGWLERGVSPEAALKEIAEKQRDAAPKVPAVPGHLDLSDRDRKAYNIGRAMMAAGTGDWSKAGFEREVSTVIADRSNRQTKGFFVPMDMGVELRTHEAQRLGLLGRASVTGNIAATASLGGAGVQTTIVGFIDVLRARTRVMQAGATVLTGLTDTVQFTKQLTPNTMYWVGENPSTANTLTAATLGTVTLSPKVAMSSTAYSRRLLSQFSFDVNAFVMNDLTKVNAIGVDSAALVGTGANSQPTGIVSQSSVTLQTVGSNGAAAAWSDIVLAETNVANANADIGPMAWIASPKVRGKWKNTLKSTTAGSLYLWGTQFGGGGADEVNGYPAFVSTNIPDNITQGTSTTICSTPIFGVWDQLLIGEWGGAMEVVVDPYSFSQQNMIQVVTSLMVDVQVRQPTAFSVLLGVLTS